MYPIGWNCYTQMAIKDYNESVLFQIGWELWAYVWKIYFSGLLAAKGSCINRWENVWMNGWINLLEKHLLHYCFLDAASSNTTNSVKIGNSPAELYKQNIHTKICTENKEHTFKIKLEHFFCHGATVIVWSRSTFRHSCSNSFLAFQFCSIKIQIEIKSRRKKIDGPYQKVHRQ